MSSVREVLKAQLPEPMLGILRRFVYRRAVLKNLRGYATRTCPICNFEGRFHAFGHPPQYDARCPSCSALNRQRLLKLAIERLNLINSGDKVLHLAPEEPVARTIKDRGGSYVSGDITPGRADLVLDLHDLALPDAAYDVIVANHVLEHVEDAKALPELRRVLRRGGRLIVTIPIIEGWDSTYENPAVTSDRERELHFGQFDHLRYFGRDFRQRVKSAGFSLTEFVADGAETVTYGLVPGERVFIGTAIDIGRQLPLG